MASNALGGQGVGYGPFDPQSGRSITEMIRQHANEGAYRAQSLYGFGLYQNAASFGAPAEITKKKKKDARPIEQLQEEVDRWLA